MLADDPVDAYASKPLTTLRPHPNVDALKAGKHVYAEKPMTKTVEEALDVVKVWKDTGRVMQVESNPRASVWDQAENLLTKANLAKYLVIKQSTSEIQTSGSGVTMN